VIFPVWCQFFKVMSVDDWKGMTPVKTCFSYRPKFSIGGPAQTGVTAEQKKQNLKIVVVMVECFSPYLANITCTLHQDGHNVVFCD